MQCKDGPLAPAHRGQWLTMRGSTGTAEDCRALLAPGLLRFLNDRIRGVAGDDPAGRPSYYGFILEP